MINDKRHAGDGGAEEQGLQPVGDGIGLPVPDPKFLPHEFAETGLLGSCHDGVGMPPDCMGMLRGSGFDFVV